jgi:hypothetical protein
VPHEKDKNPRLKTMQGFDDVVPVFANYARVSHTGVNFEIGFARIGPATGEMADLGKVGVKATAVVRVVLPNEFVPALIQALKDNYDRHTARVEQARAEVAVAKEVSGVDS